MSSKYYYIQGFRLDDTFESIKFILSLSENRITTGPKVTVHYKVGATTNDFINKLPTGISIDSDKLIMTKYNRLLKPKRLKFNSHLVSILDLDSRLVNYVVAKNEVSTLFEDENHTSWVISPEVADDESKLRPIIEDSKYVCWESLPLGEYYSYRSVNTSASHDLTDRVKPKNLNDAPQGNGSPTNADGSPWTDDGTGNVGGSSAQLVDSNVPTIVSRYNNPIDFSTYTKWRLEFSAVLLGFYDQLKLQLPEFDIYMDGQKIKCLDNMNSNKIDIRLDNLANMDRRPFIYRHDLYQSKAELSMNIRTTDQLKYMHLKKKFQNIELISNITEYSVKDKKGLDWLNHIWWEKHTDATQLSSVRDNEGRVSFNLELRCTIHFYEVEDELFELIKFIKVCFANLPGKPSKRIELKNNNI